MNLEDELIKAGFKESSTWHGGLYLQIRYEPEDTSCRVQWSKLNNYFSMVTSQTDYDNATHTTELPLPYIKDMESLKILIKLITNMEL